MAKGASRYVGSASMLKNLARLREQFPDHFAAALRKEAEIEATECKKRCPVQTGALRASIHVEGPTRDGRKIQARVVAGGPSLGYALTVHEDLDAYHKNGEAKFIERPLKEAAPHMGERIAKDLRTEGRL
jgi:hypothetical protein